MKATLPGATQSVPPRFWPQRRRALRSATRRRVACIFANFCVSRSLPIRFFLPEHGTHDDEVDECGRDEERERDGRRPAGRNRRRVSLRDLVNLLRSRVEKRRQGRPGDRARERHHHTYAQVDPSGREQSARGSHRVASRSRHAGQDGGGEFRTGPERTLRTKVSRRRSDPRPIPLVYISPPTAHCHALSIPPSESRAREEPPAMTRLSLSSSRQGHRRESRFFPIRAGLIGPRCDCFGHFQYNRYRVLRSTVPRPWTRARRCLLLLIAFTPGPPRSSG